MFGTGETGVAVADGALLTAAVGLAAARAELDARRAGVLAELERRGVCDMDHGLSTGSWLARETKVPSGHARRDVRVSKVLGDSLPLVAAALSQSRLTWEHVIVLADAAAHPRVGSMIVELQQELIDAAQGVLFDRWKREIASLIELLDQDGPDPGGDLTANVLYLSKTIDGVAHLIGSFTGEQALVLAHAIEDKADELFRRNRRDHHESHGGIELLNRAQLRAQALVELVRGGQAVDLESTRAPVTEVSIVVNAEQPTEAWTVDGIALQDGSIRVLRCDPILRAVIVDHLGVPLDLGRRFRWASAAQRQAIAVRDGGCAFPGCDKPISWCDLHHVQPWEHGGPTDLLGLVPLCRHHHGIIHRKGWRLDPTNDGWYLFTTPKGRRFWSQRHGRQREHPPPRRCARAPSAVP